MDAKTMNDTLLAKAEELKNDLIQLEQDFNIKKEQYLKIQGALEALSELDKDSSSSSAE
jgi:hypothetical protein